MRAYRETFRRHRLLYLLPALVAALLVGAVSYKSPTYVSTASLWIDNQSSSASSLDVGPGPNQATAPSGAEQTLLGELLTTRKFEVAVARGAGLAGANAASSPIAAQIGTGVTSTAPGPQVLQVAYTGSSPAAAQKIVKSVITQLQSFSEQWARSFAKAAVAYDQAQVASATRALQQAKAAIGTAATGPSFATETSALTAATTALSQAQAQAQGNPSFSTVVALGEPSFNPAPLTGYKKMVGSPGTELEFAL